MVEGGNDNDDDNVDAYKNPEVNKVTSDQYNDKQSYSFF